MRSIKNVSLPCNHHKAMCVLEFLLVIFLLPAVSYSQHPADVSATIDTTTIKIGEQIHYTITVTTDSTAVVHFPEGQTFSPLETVEALQIDTVQHKNRRILQRLYTLTRFDSGTYTIPRQRIAINEQPFFTDSFRIKIADVAVDTTQQKLYDIKPLMEVQKSHTALWNLLLWILAGLVVTGGLAYWFILRKKPYTEAEKEALLPPYDRALLELKKLENSKYLIRNEYKEYYSELTTIIRSYLEEDVHIAALESTTEQLITKLEMLKNTEQLKLNDETLIQFQKLLQTADLVKFAKSKPSPTAAEQDRQLVEQIVLKTHEALPQPTQEELLQNKEYRAKLTQKQQRRKRYWAIGIFAALLLVGGTFSITYLGSKHVKNILFGSATKTLLQGEWITSSYGYPPIELETPKVLLRQNVTLPPETEEIIKENQLFAYGNYVDVFATAVHVVTYKKPIPPNFEVALEGMLTTFEKLGLKNITTKQEEFSTKTGVKGLKTYGTGNFKNPENNTTKNLQYNIFSFGGKGFMQQIILTWEKGDSYAEQIISRIVNSIEVKTQG